ncbi:MAG: response regulator [Thermodesulfobacteriota bacterium]
MSQNRGTILIVDDEAGPRESLRMILKPIYNIFTASNGKEALEIIQKENIDLVTLDLNMPGLSGIEVLKEIKKIKSDVEVIIVTGYGTLKNAQEVIRYGAGDFISKPFNVADIVAIVSKSFERRNYNLKINNLIQQIKGLKSMNENQILEKEVSFR